jgi:CheY-like chemotaxis protein
VAHAVLLACGCEVQLASNGSEALQAIQKEHFDLVLMDCQMPEMDGYAATRALRALEAQGMMWHIPVVALTANATQADRQLCLDAGMDSFFNETFYAIGAAQGIGALVARHRRHTIGRNGYAGQRQGRGRGAGSVCAR